MWYTNLYNSRSNSVAFVVYEFTEFTTWLDGVVYI